MDRNVHETPAGWLANETLLDQIRVMNRRMSIFRLIEFQSLEPIRSTCMEHRRILEAIAAGDVAAARECIRQNIQDARDKVATSIKEALARSYMRRS